MVQTLLDRSLRASGGDGMTAKKTRRVSNSRSKENANAKRAGKFEEEVKQVVGIIFRDIESHAEISTAMWRVAYMQDKLDRLRLRRLYWSLPWWRRMVTKRPV